MQTSTNRRTVLGSIAVASVAPVALAFKAHARNTAQKQDAAILAAFDRWTDGFKVIAARRDINDETPEEREAWAAIDSAEDFIGRNTAHTPEAAEAALWCAVKGMADDGLPHDAHIVRNLDALLSDEGLNWDTKLALRSIANLRAMKGA